ncbi:hypothetical protein ZWY2020_060004 [Hordeum vulgare]|nr:hypothetical protein ZWY2020_060004 [Hordeum vulgare]
MPATDVSSPRICDGACAYFPLHGSRHIHWIHAVLEEMMRLVYLPFFAYLERPEEVEELASTHRLNIRPNDFHDIPEYFVLEEIPHAVALVRSSDKSSPRQAVEFILQLLK